MSSPLGRTFFECISLGKCWRTALWLIVRLKRGGLYSVLFFFSDWLYVCLKELSHQ